MELLCLDWSQPGIETRALIANPPNSAQQLVGTPTIPLGYIRVCAVVCEGQTDTQTAVTTIQLASSTTHAKCNQSHEFIHMLQTNAMFRTLVLQLTRLTETGIERVQACTC